MQSPSKARHVFWINTLVFSTERALCWWRRNQVPFPALSFTSSMDQDTRFTFSWSPTPLSWLSNEAFIFSHKCLPYRICLVSIWRTHQCLCCPLISPDEDHESHVCDRRLHKVKHCLDVSCAGEDAGLDCLCCCVCKKWSDVHFSNRRMALKPLFFFFNFKNCIRIILPAECITAFVWHSSREALSGKEWGQRQNKMVSGLTVTVSSPEANTAQ